MLAHAVSIDITSAKGAPTVTEPTTAERGVARRTAESRATVPDVELSVVADAGAALARAARAGVTFDAVLLAACAAALRAHPRANSAYRDGRFEAYARVNVGWVVAADDAYLIPTVFDADTKSLAELAAEIAELDRGARARSLTAPAFSGATFTVWNAGALGVDRASSVVVPPQAGALTAGAARETPVVRDGLVVPGQTVTLTLASDHRILYGAAAAAFLGTVRAELERH
jgi:pyruvate dehydrogenase E2 component (dihydrolipoamide acetyltransferase)